MLDHFCTAYSIVRISGNDGWTNIFNKTNEVLSLIREDGGILDEALVFFMMRNCRKANAVKTERFMTLTCAKFSAFLPLGRTCGFDGI